MNLVNITLYTSIILQFLAGFVGLDGFRYNIPKQDTILKTILGIETGVQLVELIFYLMFVFIQFPIENIASIRYYDWFFTTPSMLLSTMLFFYYKRTKENNSDDIPTISSFLQKYKWETGIVLIANALMLILGYAGEMKIVSIMSAFVWGFVFFAVAFYEIWDVFVVNKKTETITNENNIEELTDINNTNININIEKMKKEKVSYQNEIMYLFIFLFVVWSLYGIVYPFNAELKNISFNILDVISKNFYGLFIYWKILQLI
jgi:bacteriorhodopsin